MQNVIATPAGKALALSVTGSDTAHPHALPVSVSVDGTSAKGSISELMVIADILRRGWEVYLPLPNRTPKIDLLAFDPITMRVFPVSVKSTSVAAQIPAHPEGAIRATVLYHQPIKRNDPGPPIDYPKVPSRVRPPIEPSDVLAKLPSLFRSAELYEAFRSFGRSRQTACRWCRVALKAGLIRAAGKRGYYRVKDERGVEMAGNQSSS